VVCHIYSVDILITRYLVLCHHCHGLTLWPIFLYIMHISQFLQARICFITLDFTHNFILSDFVITITIIILHSILYFSHTVNILCTIYNSSFVFSSLKLYKWLCYRSSEWNRRKKSVFRQLPVYEEVRSRSIRNGGPCQRETARRTWRTICNQGRTKATHYQFQEIRSGHYWEGSINTYIRTPIHNNSSLMFPKWGASIFLELFTYLQAFTNTKAYCQSGNKAVFLCTCGLLYWPVVTVMILVMWEE